MTNKEAIKILKSKLDGNIDTSYEWCEAVRLAINALEDRPQGEWINTGVTNGYWATEYQCSICGAKNHWHNYCPNCGVHMLIKVK